MRWFLLLALAGLVLPSPAGAEPSAQPRRIVVTGVGRVERPPDQATVEVGVQVQRPAAADALGEAGRAAQRVVAAVGRLGLQGDAVRTTGVALHPVYGPDGQTVVGYRAFVGVSVWVRDLALVGRALDATASGGANVVRQVSFGLRDPSAVRAQALRLAVDDARTKAEAIRRALGARLRGVEHVVEEGVELEPLVARAEAAVPVLPGNVVVVARVRVTYRY